MNLEKIIKNKKAKVAVIGLGYVGLPTAVELAKRKYFAAPVVDSENHMLGIIKAERMIQGVREDVTKDIQMMFGAGGDERVSSTILFSIKKRLPWLHVNLAPPF